MMRSDRLPILFHQPTTNNKQVARPFFLAFLNCIDSNHLLIISSLLGFEKLKTKNNLFGNNIQIF